MVIVGQNSFGVELPQADCSLSSDFPGIPQVPGIPEVSVIPQVPEIPGFFFPTPRFAQFGLSLEQTEENSQFIENQTEFPTS